MSAAYDCPAFLSCGQRLEGWISIYEESFFVCVLFCSCSLCFYKINGATCLQLRLTYFVYWNGGKNKADAGKKKGQLGAEVES